MNKEIFLQKLSNYLAVLDEKEQQDILDEYTQHIDMKMKEGMSEEEAIRDFGDMKELAADILEAYHVNPRFEEQQTKDVPSLKTASRVVKRGKGILKRAKGVLQRGASLLGKGIGRCCHFLAACIKKPCFWLAGIWNKVFRHSDEPLRESAFVQEKTAEKRAETAPGSRQKEGIIQRSWRFLCRLCRTVWNFFISCLKWCRNLLMIGFSLFVMAAALFFLFCFGTVVVLAVAGYPLTGILLACLGALLSLSSLTFFCFCCTWKFLKKSQKEESSHA